MTAKHMVSQNTRKSCRLVKSMNVFEKRKNRLCPFSFVKSKTKEGKHLAVNRQQNCMGHRLDTPMSAGN